MNNEKVFSSSCNTFFILAFVNPASALANSHFASLSLPQVPVGKQPSDHIQKPHLPDDHPLDPMCFTTSGIYLGVCGILPGVDCKVISGSVFGGWVKCRNYNFGSGYIGCYISWPFCTFYRFY